MYHTSPIASVVMSMYCSDRCRRCSQGGERQVVAVWVLSFCDLPKCLLVDTLPASAILMGPLDACAS